MEGGLVLGILFSKQKLSFLFIFIVVGCGVEPPSPNKDQEYINLFLQRLDNYKASEEQSKFLKEQKINVKISSLPEFGEGIFSRVTIIGIYIEEEIVLNREVIELAEFVLETDYKIIGIRAQEIIVAQLLPTLVHEIEHAMTDYKGEQQGVFVMGGFENEWISYLADLKMFQEMYFENPNVFNDYNLYIQKQDAFKKYGRDLKTFKQYIGSFHKSALNLTPQEFNKTYQESSDAFLTAQREINEVIKKNSPDHYQYQEMQDYKNFINQLIGTSKEFKKIFDSNPDLLEKNREFFAPLILEAEANFVPFSETPTEVPSISMAQ